jgi:trypanothione synthetase/amidase
LLGKTSISGNTTNAPYGAITGYASTNVPAYSNGNDTYISEDPSYLYGIYTGMKWQCVEYARRWIFLRKECVFDSVDAAANMWTQLNNVQRVVDNQCFNLKKYSNGSPNPPQNESLIIYKNDTTDMPFGHVAVIIDILPAFIRVAEQNYYPYYWSANYSRQIPYGLINGSYYIQDDYDIFGWMTIEDKNNQTKPLDQSTINKIIQLNQSSPTFICANNAKHYYFSVFNYLFFILFYFSVLD